MKYGMNKNETGDVMDICKKRLDDLHKKMLAAIANGADGPDAYRAIGEYYGALGAYEAMGMGITYSESRAHSIRWCGLTISHPTWCDEQKPGE